MLDVVSIQNLLEQTFILMGIITMLPSEILTFIVMCKQ